MTIWQNLRDLTRHHPKALAGFVLALAVTLFFAVRFVSQALYWHDPAHYHQTVQPWMTMGYVAKSWGLHGPDIDTMAGLPPPEQGHPFTITEIARKRGVPVADIIKLVNDTVAKLEAAAPKPAGDQD